MKNKHVAVKQNCHAELVSASTPLITIQNKEEILKHYSKIPDKNLPGRGQAVKAAVQDNVYKEKTSFQGLSIFTTALGFTLIELLVVVLIIGILVAVAFPQYQKVQEKTRFQEMINVGYTLSKGQNLYFLAHGTYASSIAALNVSFKPAAHDPKVIQLSHSRACGISDTRTICNQYVRGDLVLVYFSQRGKITSCTTYGSFSADHLCASLPESKSMWKSGCLGGCRNWIY